MMPQLFSTLEFLKYSCLLQVLNRCMCVCVYMIVGLRLFKLAVHFRADGDPSW